MPSPYTGIHSKVGVEVFFATGRNLKTSSLFTRLEDHHAVNNQIMGLERPIYFKTEQQIKGIYIDAKCPEQSDSGDGILNC